MAIVKTIVDAISAVEMLRNEKHVDIELVKQGPQWVLYVGHHLVLNTNDEMSVTCYIMGILTGIAMEKGYYDLRMK